MMQLAPIAELGLNRMSILWENFFSRRSSLSSISCLLRGTKQPLPAQYRCYYDDNPRRRENDDKFPRSRFRPNRGFDENVTSRGGLFEDDDVENRHNDFNSRRRFRPQEEEEDDDSNHYNPRFDRHNYDDENRRFGKGIRNYKPNLQSASKSPNYIELGERKPFKTDGLSEEISEYKPRLIDNVLTLAAKTHKHLEKEGWNALKKEAVEKFRLASDANFGGVMLGNCIGYKNFSLGKSLMDFIRQEDAQSAVSPVILAKYLRLCYECFEMVGEQAVLNIYEETRKNCQLFDSSSAENIILALCKTSKWKDAAEFLEMIEITSRPSVHVYSQFIKTAFSHQEYELGWKYLEKMASESKVPHEYVYAGWLQECKRVKGQEQKEMVDKLLAFFREHEIYPQKSTAEIIKFMFESRADEHWVGNYTSVSLDKCKCPACHGELENISLTGEQFEALRTGFLGNVIEGTDVFRKTTPTELEKFKSLVSTTAPYDIVLDGLNVAMFQSNAHRLEHTEQLVAVVRQLSMKKNKILLLGRKHMLTWPRKGMEFIQYRAHCFFAENLSKDDPFMLYAAMSSGLGTVFVSRDLMRNHCYSVKDPKLRKYFKQWQRKHQLLLVGVEPDGTLRYRPPLEVNPVTQCNNESLHIPYDDGIEMCKTTIEAPKSWLCLVKSKDALRPLVK